jgi:GNAT superfamily N-acetyltransferase
MDALTQAGSPKSQFYDVPFFEAGEQCIQYGQRHNPTHLFFIQYPPMDNVFIRPAVISEQRELEDLQLRASLNNAGDRDSILAHPDAIEVPLRQIAGGGVFVSEQNDAIVGFAAVEPRADGNSELDALFVDPRTQRRGIGRSLITHCAEVARTGGSGALYRSGTHTQRIFTWHAISR